MPLSVALVTIEYRALATWLCPLMRSCLVYHPMVSIHKSSTCTDLDLCYPSTRSALGACPVCGGISEQGLPVMQAKAQAVTAQLAEATLKLDRLKLQQRELGKLLGQAQTRSISLPGQGQVVITTKSSYKGIACLLALLAVCSLLPSPLYSDGCSTARVHVYMYQCDSRHNNLLCCAA